MKIIDIARTFDMSVDQFAKYIGYSRQALYQNDIRMTPKARIAIERLEQLHSSKEREEMLAVKTRSLSREKAMDEFMDRLLYGGVKING